MKDAQKFQPIIATLLPPPSLQNKHSSNPIPFVLQHSFHSPDKHSLHHLQEEATRGNSSMASTSAVSMAMPPACAAAQKAAPPTSSFFQPLPLRLSNKVTVSSPSSRLVVRASLKEKAVTGLTAAALTASMMVPDVAEAAVSPSLKNFLLSIAAGGVVLAAIVGAVIGVANFDPVKRS